MKGLISFFLVIVLALPAFADPAATKALNDYRASKGRAPLIYSSPLETAALSHALDMMRNGFFEHTGSDGSDVGERVRRSGYGWCFVAENVAKGQRSLVDVMDDWANSRGHRRNMLNRKAEEFALVKVEDRIWVMVLAAPGC